MRVIDWSLAGHVFRAARRETSMRRFTTGIAIALALSIAACASSDATSPTVSIAGTYALKSINGTVLPYSFTTSLTLTSDVLTMTSSGSYTDVATYSNGTSTTEQGTYSTNNGSITFTDFTDNVVYQGSLSGSVLTEISGSYTEVFQKN
jgi:hypothetical protein